MELERLKIFPDVKLIKRALSFMLAVMMVMPSIMYSVFACMADVKAEAPPLEVGDKLIERFPINSGNALAWYIYQIVLGKSGSDWKEYELTDVDIGKITARTNINLGAPGIVDLTGIEYFTNLESLTCAKSTGSGDMTFVDEIDLSQNTALKSVTLTSGGFSADASSLKKLILPETTTLTYVGVSRSQLTELDVSKNTGLTSLSLIRSPITKLDLSKNTALTNLTLENTGITELDLSNNTELTSLNVQNTGITELDVSKNTALTSLYAGDTNITKLALSNNTALTDLSVGSTGITEIDLSNHTALTSLAVDSTGITELDLSNNTALTSLYAGDTNITELDLSNNTELMMVNVPNAKLKSLDLTGINITGSFTNLSGQVPVFEYEKTEDGKYKILDIPLDGRVSDLMINDTAYEESLTNDIIVDDVPEKISYNYDTNSSGDYGKTLEVTSAKTYNKSASVADEETGISIDGSLEDGASLKVENITENDETYNKLLEAMGEHEEVLMSVDVSIVGGTYTPGSAMTLTFSVDPQYNGRTVIIKHLLSDGTIDTYTAIVSDGKVQITVTELSPFMIALAKEAQNPNPGDENPGEDLENNNSNQDNENDDDIVSYGSEYQTGDNANTLGLMLILIISGSVLTIASCLIYRNKKLYKK